MGSMRYQRMGRRCFSAMAVGASLLLVAAASATDPLSEKRGFADVGSSDGELRLTNSAWYYNWGPRSSAEVSTYDAEFLPMIWSGGQANQANIDRILGYDNVEWVLGFNEPERTDQANMSVDAAINVWRTLDAGFRDTDIKLVSPAPSDTGDGQAWLADFMGRANAEGLQVDGVAFHWYGASTPNDPIQAGRNFLGRVDSYYNRYGLPVFITEFAMHDWGGNHSDESMRAANQAFLEYVVPRLESRSYVEKYSFYNWFSDARLFEGNPALPTNIGQTYAGAIQSGDTYDLSGKQMGDRVAYLAGGELTYSANGRGNVNYLHALEGVSSISGEVDWGLEGSDWGQVEAQATLQKIGPNRVTIDTARWTSDGLVEVREGEFAVIGGTRISGSGGFRVTDGGTLTVGGRTPESVGRIAQAIELAGGVYQSTAGPSGPIAILRPLEGSGDVAGSLIVEPGGLVSPADPNLGAGLIAISGDYEALGGSELRIDLQSTRSNDRVEVGGELRAGGKLTVAWLRTDGLPAAGDRFDVLDFTTSSGAFEAIELPELDAPNAWDLSGLYTEGVIGVTSVPGDFNDDGLVDAADYAFWRDHLGSEVGVLANDPHGVPVGELHLATWEANYGRSVAQTVAVPEPAALASVLIAVGLFWAPRLPRNA